MARCDAAETAYMLGQLEALFPGFEIDERHRWIAEQAETSGLDQRRVGSLLERYGTTAARVAGQELVGRLEDVLSRRTTLAITGQLSRALIDEVAAAIAPTMGLGRSAHDRWHAQGCAPAAFTIG